MNRKTFLNLGTKASLFFGITPSLIACKNNAINSIEEDQVKEALLSSKATGSALSLTNTPISTVRIGIIGLGNRGSVLINMHEWLIKNKHAKIVALSDLKEEKVIKTMII